jgi:hypothetical protein
VSEEGQQAASCQLNWFFLCLARGSSLGMKKVGEYHVSNQILCEVEGRLGAQMRGPGSLVVDRA